MMLLRGEWGQNLGIQTLKHSPVTLAPETEEGRSPVQGHSGLHSKTPSQNNINNQSVLHLLGRQAKKWGKPTVVCEVAGEMAWLV